jgi:hypothetical protein
MKYGNLGISTPWGMADSANRMTERITFYGTPSHGGAKVPADLQKIIPAPLRYKGGWYEEDCAIHIVEYFFYDSMKAFYAANPHEWHYTISQEEWFGKYTKAYMAESVKRWHAAEWELATGENLEEWAKAQGEYTYNQYKERKEQLAMPKPEIGKMKTAKIVSYGKRGMALQNEHGQLLGMPNLDYLKYRIYDETPAKAPVQLVLVERLM